MSKPINYTSVTYSTTLGEIPKLTPEQEKKMKEAVIKMENKIKEDIEDFLIFGKPLNRDEEDDD